MLGKDRKLLYVHLKSTWEVYFLQSGTRNKYKKAGLQVTKLPLQWRPINVIKLSGDKIQGIIPDHEIGTEESFDSTQVGNFTDPIEKRILGRFEINPHELQRLTLDWHNQPMVLLCGSDGGLKGNIGTSGYALYSGTSDIPVVAGYAAELQFHESASSTRQELLAQLCVVYWISHLIERLGEPKETLEAFLVTDSQASIDIMENMERIIGLKDVLTPDIDVAMALSWKRKQIQRCKLEVVKVTSHISLDEAPDETHWMINEEADRLATLAQQEVLQGNLTAAPPGMLPGVKAICSSTGRILNRELKTEIQAAVCLPRLEEFLCLKYGWTRKIFTDINWKAHEAVIFSHQILKRVTVLKYVHGWLATQKRRWWEGTFHTPQCMLCQEIEDRGHMFCCSHERMVSVRNTVIQNFDAKVQKITSPEIAQALSVGIRSILGDANASVYRREFAPNKLVEQIMQRQEEIGWDHFLFGRMTRQWSELGPNESYTEKPKQWEKQIACYAVAGGLEIWKERNFIIHGTDGGASKLEEAKTEETIRALYNDILPSIHPSHKWLFHVPVEVKLTEQYTREMTWIDSVRRLYPQEYKNIRTQIGLIDFRPEKVEYTKANKSGINRGQ